MAKTRIPRSPGKLFLMLFGEQGGRWFAEGKTLDEANTLFLAELARRIPRINAQLAESGKPKAKVPPAARQKDELTRKLTPHLGKSLARFAANIKFRGRG